MILVNWGNAAPLVRAWTKERGEFLVRIDVAEKIFQSTCRAGGVEENSAGEPTPVTEKGGAK